MIKPRLYIHNIYLFKQLSRLSCSICSQTLAKGNRSLWLLMQSDADLLEVACGTTIFANRGATTLANSFLCKFLVSISVLASFTFNLRFWAFAVALSLCTPPPPPPSCQMHRQFLFVCFQFSVLFSFLLSSLEIVFYMAKCNLCNWQTRQTASAATTTNSILCYTLKVKSLSIFVAVVVASVVVVVAVV